MTLTPHARKRLASRLSAADVSVALDRLTALPAREGRRAVVLVRLAEQHGKPRGPSNGDLIVAICDREAVITVMYRRSSQPLTPGALDVDVVDDYERLAPDPVEDEPCTCGPYAPCPQHDLCDDCGRPWGHCNLDVEH